MFNLPEWKYLKYQIEDKWRSLTASKGYTPPTYTGDSFWQKLNLRQRLQMHPAVIGGLSIIVIITMVTIFITSLIGPARKIERNPNAWFYDLNTGKLFTAERTAIPPIKAPSGPLPNGQPAGVLANVVVYQGPEDQSEPVIKYLEKLTPAGKQKLAELYENGEQARMRWAQERLIRRVEDEEWAKADSPEGRAIVKEMFKPNEKGQAPKLSLPE